MFQKWTDPMVFVQHRNNNRDICGRCHVRKGGIIPPHRFMLVPKLPLMDYVGRPLLGGIFVALLLLQWRFPLRRQHFSALHRLIRNVVLSLPGFAVVRLAMLPIPIAVAMWAQDRHVGLLNWLAPAGWVAGIATV